MIAKGIAKMVCANNTSEKYFFIYSTQIKLEIAQLKINLQGK